jgi:hypothetical protein
MFNRLGDMYGGGETPEVQIQKAKDLVSSLEYDVEKYTTLLECAKQRRIEMIKSNVNYYMFQPYLRQAWEWINIDKPKLKRKPRKKPNEECVYDMLLDQIKKFVYKDLKGVTIGEIYECGFGAAYQYSIEFFIPNKKSKGMKRRFVFSIPVIERLNESCYQFTSEGRLQLGEYTSQSACEVFFSTYDENELYDALVKRLSETYYNTEEAKT